MRRGGARTLQDEKVLVQELGRLFHVARANAREQRVIKRAAARTEEGSASPSKPRTGKASEKKPKKKKSNSKKGKKGKSSSDKSRRARGPRRKTRGGTVWVVLKGGFTRVPTTSMTAIVEHNKVFRGRLSEQRRLAALEAAEAYVQTAWQQAQEAGLLLPDGSGPNSDEGLEYLREQYDVAAGMLRREPVGARLKQVVESTISSSAAVGAADMTTAVPETVYDRDQWADIITRENVILRRFSKSLPLETDNTEAVLAEAAEVPSKFYFQIAEPLAPQDSNTLALTPNSSSADLLHGEQVIDVLPTKCIVRIRGSGGKKHTTIISTPKGVNSFKSNFMQLIRKEISNSKLPRGEHTVESKQHHQRTGSGSGTSDNASRGQPKRHNNRRRK